MSRLSRHVTAYREPLLPEARLDHLIRELLLVHTDGLDGPRLAAFIDGWTTMLELVGRTDVLMPGAPRELTDGVRLVVERIRDAQDRVLDDDDDL